MLSSVFWYGVHWVVSAIALLCTAYLVRGIEVASFSSALIAAVAIGFANVMIRPVLMLLTLPLNILTLGLFTLVVNGAILKIVAAFLPGFTVETWLAAIFGSVVLWFVGMILHFLLP